MKNIYTVVFFAGIVYAFFAYGQMVEIMQQEYGAWGEVIAWFLPIASIVSGTKLFMEEK